MTMTLTLPATAHLPEAAALAQQFGAEIAAGSGPAVLDASALSTFDTSTIALLMQLQRDAKRSGRTLDLQGLPAQLRQLAELYGVDGLLGTAPASDSASTAPAAGPVTA